MQYSDKWSTSSLGSRAETGRLQQALQDAQQTWLAVNGVAGDYQVQNLQMQRQVSQFQDLITKKTLETAYLADSNDKVYEYKSAIVGLKAGMEAMKLVAEKVEKTASDVVAEAMPKILGALAVDATSGGRAVAKGSGITASLVLKALAIASQTSADVLELKASQNEQHLSELMQSADFTYEEKQLAYELDQAFIAIKTHANDLYQLLLAHQRALEQVNNVIAQGNRIQAEREVFRQRAAAVIQGYRTKDLTFRLFRNEALEQYRSLFDLASRYTYLAAKGYDYESGLLGTTQGRSVFANIVASRSLGDLTGGIPQSTSSTLGDAGLAGSMAQLNSEWSVAKGRLGINNPSLYSTVFSLRSELFRIRTDAAIRDDDDAWQQTLQQHIVADVRADPDVAALCMSLSKPDGTPVPGIVIPFSTVIQTGKNFFGLPLAAGDHAYTSSNFATKIDSVGISLPGYVGMDTYAAGQMGAGAPASSDPNAMSATPYVYLIPCGVDTMLAPPFGDTGVIRSWMVQDQALPLPYNLGGTDFNGTQFFNANGTLNGQPWIIRKHAAFRAVSDPALFYGLLPQEFTNSRLVARSVWNSQWKLVIPAYTLLSNEQEGLNRFVGSVFDIQLFLRTYSHSGN